MADTPLTILLIDLEIALQQAGLWSEDKPSEEALTSLEPFCINTLDFHQWLQFVFLPRMHYLSYMHLQLPEKCEIAAMAETIWQNNHKALSVIKKLHVIDSHIYNNRQPKRPPTPSQTTAIPTLNPRGSLRPHN